MDDVGGTSEIVTWEYEEEVEEFPYIIWIVAILGFMGLAVIVASQARKQVSAKSYAAHETFDEEEDTEEATEEAVASEDAEAADDEEDTDVAEEDENAEEADEEGQDEEVEDQPSEEQEEETFTSIYDLQPDDE